MKGTTTSVNVIKAPPYARTVKFQGFVEVASHTANDLIYNVRVFAAGVSVEDAYVNYQHTVSGQIRIQISGFTTISVGQDLDLRFIQSSGSDKTVAVAYLAAEFD
jgi:hypothetical protein